MYRNRSFAGFFSLSALIFFLPGIAHAEEDSWYALPHAPVSSFTVAPDGSAEGVTEDGTSFRQYPVYEDATTRIQRFEMGTHYHYIVNGEIVDSLAELSLLLPPQR